jgi:hypothetical protein
MRFVAPALLAMLLATGSARAEVVFTQPDIELGSLRTGQNFEQTLTYTNNGKGAVEVLEAKGSCACLLPEFAATTLRPGQSGNLKLKVNTLSATPGQEVWRVTLKYREAGQVKEAAAIIRASIIQEIIVQPPQIIVYASSSTPHDVAVVDLRSKPLHVVKAEATSPHFKVQLLQEGQDAEGHKVQLVRLDIGPTLPVGRHDEQLTIYTDDPKYRELKVAVTAVRRGRQRYSAFPPEVNLLAATGETTVQRMVTIRDQQGQPVVIEKVTADDAAVICDWSKGPNSVGTVKVTVDCTKVKTLTLDSKAHVQFANGEKLTLPVRCEGK